MRVFYSVNVRVWNNYASRPVYSDTTQLNSTRRRVELSCVAINGPSDSLLHPAVNTIHIIDKQIMPTRTSSSAVAKRPRDAACLSAVSFNSTKRRAQLFYC